MGEREKEKKGRDRERGKNITERQHQSFAPNDKIIASNLLARVQVLDEEDG